MNDTDKISTAKFSNATDDCCSNDSCCAPETPFKRLLPKVGLNDPCPCGSERKFKKCCERNS